MIESITETLDQLTSLNTSIMMYIPSVIGLCAFLASVFPKPIPGTFLAKVHKWINIIAFNVKHAKNKDE